MLNPHSPVFGNDGLPNVVHVGALRGDVGTITPPPTSLDDGVLELDELDELELGVLEDDDELELLDDGVELDELDDELELGVELLDELELELDGVLDDELLLELLLDGVDELLLELLDELGVLEDDEELLELDGVLDELLDDDEELELLDEAATYSSNPKSHVSLRVSKSMSSSNANVPSPDKSVPSSIPSEPEAK
jgi:hypothetical protein